MGRGGMGRGEVAGLEDRAILRLVHELDGSEVSTLRWINERAVLRLLFDSDRARSVAEIAAARALSRPTVEGTLAQLLREGWVLESEPQTSGRGAGRPAKYYAFADRSKLIMGVDLGPHGVICTAATLRGEVLATARIADLDIPSGEQAFAALVDAVTAALTESGRAEKDVIALTVGLPAIVDARGDVSLTVVVPEWRSFRLTERIRERFASMHVIFENDANLATVGELAWGSAVGARSMVNVLVGHRVGAGVILDGRLTRGVHGAAGEIGALPAARWESAYRRLAGPAGRVQDTLGGIADDDPAALRRLEKFAEDLARGIAALCLVLDPEVVIIGGGSTRFGERLIEPLHAAVAALTLFPVELRTSTLGQSAVALGGVAMSRDHLTHTVLQIA